MGRPGFSGREARLVLVRVACVAVLGCGGGVMSETESERLRIGREARAAFERGGVEAATGVLEAERPEDALVAYNGLGRHLFRELGQVDAMIALYEAGIRFGEAQAAAIETSDPARGLALRWTTKMITFNLAANLWPGWDDSPSLAGDRAGEARLPAGRAGAARVSPEQVAVGLAAARRNFAMTRAAGRGPKTLAIAEWMLGAHLLASGDHAGAIRHFEASASRAEEARDPAGALSAQGFVAVTRLVAHPEDADALATLENVRKALEALDDGPSYAAQFEPALRAFETSP